MDIVANFSIERHHCIDEDGKLVGHLPDFAKEMTHLVAMYRIMVLTRTFDAKAVILQRTGKIGTYPSNLGQEAIGAAIGGAMASDDVLVPAYREYAAQLQRGVSMANILAYWGGDERGNDFANKEDFPISVPIATQCLHAAGVGFAIKYRKQQRAVVSTCGDGATSKGDFYEAINLAGVWQLPIVFVVSNNQWAISLPRDKQTAAKTLAQKAIAAGFTGIQVDGNDVISMGYALREALNKARQESQPTLIEALTYRIADHTTVDDAKRYRSAGELEKAKHRDPVRRLSLYLQSKDAWNEEKEAALQMECQQQVNAAVAEYLNKTPQKVESMFDYLHATLPSALFNQRQQAMDFFEPEHSSHD